MIKTEVFLGRHDLEDVLKKINTFILENGISKTDIVEYHTKQSVSEHIEYLGKYFTPHTRKIVEYTITLSYWVEE